MADNIEIMAPFVAETHVNLRVGGIMADHPWQNQYFRWRQQIILVMDKGDAKGGAAKSAAIARGPAVCLPSV